MNNKIYNFIIDDSDLNAMILLTKNKNFRILIL